MAVASVTMTVWDELKVVLLDLQGSGALVMYPDPRVDDNRQPPFQIRLQAWATNAAESLHHRFGDNVELVVGFLRYPERKPWKTTVVMRTSPVIDAREISIETSLLEPVLVPSGYTARSMLSIHNATSDPFTVVTYGHLTAVIFDPRTGRGVGGSAQRYVTARVSDPDTGLDAPANTSSAPIVPFPVAPGSTGLIPVLVGTSSGLPELGYAIPAGEWAVQMTLELEDGRYLRTPMLPITVTD
jgi:hypothetical protein